MPSIRKFAVLLLVSVLAGGPAYSAPRVTMLMATVSSASGQPLAGVQMRVISLDNGSTVLASTTSAGLMTAQLSPGPYTVTAAGYEQVDGPRVVSLSAGEVASAALAFQSNEQPPAPTPTPSGVAAGSSNNKKKKALLILGGAAVAGGIIWAATKGPSSPSK